jgi:hypothetical protein
VWLQCRPNLSSIRLLVGNGRAGSRVLDGLCGVIMLYSYKLDLYVFLFVTLLMVVFL